MDLVMPFSPIPGNSPAVSTDAACNDVLPPRRGAAKSVGGDGLVPSVASSKDSPSEPFSLDAFVVSNGTLRLGAADVPMSEFGFPFPLVIAVVVTLADVAESELSRSNFELALTTNSSIVLSLPVFPALSVAETTTS